MKRLIALIALLLAACANAPAGFTPLAPMATPGPVLESTFVAAQATNASGTAQAFAATGAVFDAQEEQATRDAIATQQAVDGRLTLDANQRLNDAATDTAEAVATATARSEARETATAQTAGTATAQAHVAATGTGAALATAQKLSTEKKEQDLAEQALWIKALAGIVNNAISVCTGAMIILASLGIIYLSAIGYLHAREKWLKQKRLEIIPVGPNGYGVLNGHQWDVEPYPSKPPPEPEPPALPEPTPENAEAARLHSWRIACFRIAMFAHAFDWTFDTLGPEGISVVERGDWDRLTDYLFDCGYIYKRERSRTRWAEEKTYTQFRDETKLGFPRPFPPGPAPMVFNPRCTEAQLAQIAQKAQKRKPLPSPA